MSAEALYDRLHSLSKSLEGSGRLDEHENPDAYATVLDAMNFVCAALDEPAPEVCKDCNGTGMRDSGGVMPWGEPALVPCYCQPAPEAQPVARYDGLFTKAERDEVAALPDAAIAAAFRDLCGRDYSKAFATLFRAHLIERARREPVPEAQPVEVQATLGANPLWRDAAGTIPILRGETDVPVGRIGSQPYNVDGFPASLSQQFDYRHERSDEVLPAGVSRTFDDGKYYYLLSENRVWRPGSFDSLAAAVKAQPLDDEQIQALQDAANARAGGSGGDITLADVDAAGAVRC